MDGKLRQMTALYLMDGDKMLMLYRVGSRVVDPSWCGIGGHMEPDEIGNARAGVLREVQEEIGLTETDMEGLCLRYITMRHTKGELRYNHYFFARIKPGTGLPEHCAEGQLQWVPLPDVLDRTMPVSAKHMMEHYLHTGKDTDLLYGGVTTENGTTFYAMGQAEPG